MGTVSSCSQAEQTSLHQRCLSCSSSNLPHSFFWCSMLINLLLIETNQPRERKNSPFLSDDISEVKMEWGPVLFFEELNHANRDLWWAPEGWHVQIHDLLFMCVYWNCVPLSLEIHPYFWWSIISSAFGDTDATVRGWSTTVALWDLSSCQWHWVGLLGTTEVWAPGCSAALCHGFQTESEWMCVYYLGWCFLQMSGDVLPSWFSTLYCNHCPMSMVFLLLCRILGIKGIWLWRLLALSFILVFSFL